MTLVCITVVIISSCLICLAVTIDLRPYAGQTITVILPGGDESDVVVPAVDAETEPIGHFDFGASDSKPGFMYFLVEGKHSSLTIGGQSYLFEQIYHDGRELWYGKGQGDIQLIADDGTIYAGSTVNDDGEADPDDGTYTLTFKGLSNGSRPTYYTYNSNHLIIGQEVTFEVGTISRSFTVKKRNNGSIGFDWSDGTVVKNSEVSGRGVAVLIPSSNAANPPASGWIKW